MYGGLKSGLFVFSLSYKILYNTLKYNEKSVIFGNSVMIFFCSCEGVGGSEVREGTETLIPWSLASWKKVLMVIPWP